MTDKTSTEDMTKEEIEEYLDRALATGKADASNLADHILKKMDLSVQTAVQKNINGKLDSIKDHLNRQDITMGKIKKQFDDHAEVDKVFQDKTEPVINLIQDLMKSGRLVDKIVKYLLGIIVGAGAIYLSYRNIFK